MRLLKGLIVAGLIFSTSYAHAIADNAGTSAGSFLKIATDARGVVMGAAMAAMVEGADSMRWNPAGLGRVDMDEFSATHIEYYQDLNIENFSYAYPLTNGALGANVFYLSPGDLEGRNDVGAETGDFSFYDLVASAGYGRHLRLLPQGGDIYLGAAIKMVQEKIANESFQNPALDLGLLMVPSENLRAGLTLRNLSYGKADFPIEVTAGLSNTFMRLFTAGVGVIYAQDAPLRYSGAGEYRFPELQNTVLRVGYRTHDDLDDSTDSKIEALRNASLAGLTAGVGMEYRPLMFKTLRLQMDYAMAPFGALGISHTLTVKAKW